MLDAFTWFARVSAASCEASKAATLAKVGFIIPRASTFFQGLCADVNGLAKPSKRTR